MADRKGRLTFALAKGRILGPTLDIFRAAGLPLPAKPDWDRRLQIDVAEDLRLLLVKPIDVPTYVEYGIADIGVAGRDILDEQGRDLYEPVDLGIGACRLVIAEPRERPARLRRGMSLRVATKYPRLAMRHYLGKGIEPEIIPLWGSVELAPVTGLADQIVDLVESGETLRQNSLVEVETVIAVTARLVVHPASLKLKPERVGATIRDVRVAAAAATATPGVQRAQ